MRALPRGLAPLRYRTFRFLTAGQLTSNIGDSFYAVALPWYVLAEHGGPILLGVVLAAYGVPRTVLIAVGGSAADRFRPWTVMTAADSVRALAVGGLAVAAFTGPARAAVLVPIAVVLGAGEGLFLPGSMAIVPVLLPDGDLQAGNALASSSLQIATLVGPAVGGAVVALAGPAPAFVVDAATFVVSALTLLGIRSPRRAVPAAARPSVFPAVAESGGGPAIATAGVAPAAVAGGAPADGVPLVAVEDHGADAPETSIFRLIRSNRALQVIVGVVLAANLGSGGLGEVALPSLAHGPLHTGAGGYGALIAAVGAGALIGTLASGQVKVLRRPAVTASLGLLALGVSLAVIPYVGGAVPAGVALALGSVTGAFGNVVAVTLIQRSAPPAMLGRLMGVILLASYGSYPVSVLSGGIVVRDFGPAPFFPIAGGLIVLAVLAGLTQPAWTRLGAAPAAAEEAVPVAVAPAP